MNIYILIYIILIYTYIYTYLCYTPTIYIFLQTRNYKIIIFVYLLII